MFQKLNLTGLVFAVALIAGGLSGVGSTVTAVAQSPVEAPCLDFDPNLSNFRLSSTVPHDAYDANSEECAGDNSPKPPRDNLDRIKLQRVYDVFSWESFLAINWPVDTNGQTMETITADECLPAWATWAESYEVFRADGTEPELGAAPLSRSALPATNPLLMATVTMTPTKQTRVLYTVRQANSELPLWDQNGNVVYYEMLLSDEAFNQIKSLQLYNVQGQLDYSGAVRGFEFPWGSISQPETGAIQLKLAWKILDKEDIPGRFCTMEAYVLAFSENESERQWEQKTVGLVGMHIAHKTASSRNWVWSTFEHIDNVQVDDAEVLTYAEQDKTLKPSFNDPACETCPVNVEPVPGKDGLRRTQVMRVVPVAEAAAQLNRQVQAMLKEQGSIWQYYELVGTQYVTDPNSEPALPHHGFLARVTNVSGGKPAPTYLVNPVIETYDQKGNQEAGDLLGGRSNEAQSMIFGTQSCMGCHYSSGLVVAEAGDTVFRLPGTADFSFRLPQARPMELLFSLAYDPGIEDQLNQGILPAQLTDNFSQHGASAAGGPATAETAHYDDLNVPGKWYVTFSRPDREQKYVIRKEEAEFKVYILKK